MVAVGDEKLLFRQHGGDIVDVGSVCDLPETVRHALVVGKDLRGRRGGIAGEQSGNFTLVVQIERIDRRKVAEGTLHQIEAVLLGLFERLLVREDDTLLKRLQLDQTDDAVKHIMPAVGVEFLLIDKDARLLVARENAGLHPLVQQRAGLGIAVVAAFGQLEPDEVVSAARYQRFTLGCGYDVIGRADVVRQFPRLIRIPKCLNGFDFRHCFYLFFAFISALILRNSASAFSSGR